MMSKIESPRLKTVLITALPMVISQASESAMKFMDRYFLKDLGKYDMPGALTGGLTSFVFMAVFIGLAGYTTTLVSQYFGAKKPEHCVESSVQGLYLGLIAYPILLLMMPLGPFLFDIMGHEAEQIDKANTYFQILMVGGIFVLLRQGVVGYFIGIGKTRVVMIASVCGAALNIPLNYVLIFGKLGFPALGIVGAAIATVASSAFIFIVLFILFLKHSYYRDAVKRGHWMELWRIRPYIMGKLIRFGLPAGIEVGLNVFAFNYFVLLMQGISPEVSTAISITFTYDMIAFVPMLGLGIAVTSVVGQQMGAKSPTGAKKGTYLAMTIGYSYSGAMMLLFIFGAGFLVRIFSTPDVVENKELFELTKTMLRFASLYTLADVTNLIFAGALRGAGDTKFVAIISTSLHWIMIGLVSLGRFYWDLGPMELWYMFIGFVLVLGLAVVIRFKWGGWEKLEVI